MSGTSSFSCWLASILLAFGFLFVTSCGEDEVVGEEEVAIEVPTAYTFDSRFIEGKSSVSYSGQTVRNLLWQDLKILTDRLGKSGSHCLLYTSPRPRAQRGSGLGAGG